MQSTEKWLPVVGMEYLYEVSDRGKVRSRDRIAPNGRKHKGRELARTRNAGGYKKVKLSDGEKVYSRSVHRLVLEAFVGPAPAGHECCHNNGDPGDNRLENLRWDTHLENMADMVRHGNSQKGRKRTPKPTNTCTRGHEMFEANVTQVGPYSMCRACWDAHKYHRKHSLDEDSRAHLADIYFELIRANCMVPHHKEIGYNARRAW